MRIKSLVLLLLPFHVRFTELNLKVNITLFLKEVQQNSTNKQTNKNSNRNPFSNVIRIDRFTLDQQV